MSLHQFRPRSIGPHIRRKLRHYFRQTWNVGVTHHPAYVVAGLDGSRRQQQALSQLCWMPESRASFAADPFIARDTEHPDVFTILYESYSWSTRKGQIAAVDFRDGIFGPPRLALTSEGHLSYPFVFPDGNASFVLPEQSASPETFIHELGAAGELGRAQRLDVVPGLVDGSILRWQGKYWLFATHAGPDDRSALHIYHADQLPGPWRPHARNPVKRDQCNARPAGQFIEYRDATFRPAQDCGSHYGAGIVVNEIKRLTEDEFEESPVSAIRPPTGSRYDYGLHTIASSGDWTAIDGSRAESIIHPSLDRLGRYLPPW